MSENLKTIKELADELGVSKQRIQQIIAKLSPSKMPIKKGNKYVLSSIDVYNIKVLMGLDNDKSTANETTNRVVDYDIYLDVISALKQKDEQIKSLVEAQKQTQNLLDQQQRLALQDKKLLEEYKAENDNLKALKMPSEDTKEEQSSYRSLEKEKDFVQTIQESYESEIKVLNQKLAEQEEQRQERKNEKETKEKKWFQVWK